jgi:rRNA-processing protein FCF1
VAQIHLRHKSGIDPNRVADMLRERIRVGSNVVARGAGLGTDALRAAYLDWTEATELQLESVTFDQPLVRMFQTTRYWHIRRSLSDDPRPFPLVDAEVRLQVASLQSLLDDLNSRLSRFGSAPGHLAVLDTNILLHGVPPAHIPWTELLDEPDVRLIIPLRVVEELDAKKYARRSDLAERARKILAQLEEVVSAGGRAGPVMSAVTLEVSAERASRHRPSDADEEILETCQDLVQFTGQAVTLVTRDTAMRLRAQALGIRVVHLPDAYIRAVPSEGPS